MTNLGMPNIQVLFKQLAASIISRSEKGRLAMVVIDTTEAGDAVATYWASSEVKPEHYTEENYNAIKSAFLGLPLTVTVIKQSALGAFTTEAAGVLQTVSYDWACVVSSDSTDQDGLAQFIKEQNKVRKFKVKGLVWRATSPDDKQVVNFTTETYQTQAGEKEGWNLNGFVAGILAGLPFTRAVTYYKTPQISAVKEPTDMDAAVDKGELFLFNDEDGVRFSRGVNSLTTITADETDDTRSIAFVECMNIIEKDIYLAFRDYVGTYKNKLDYQMLFVAAVLGYFSQLEQEDILDNKFKNTVDIDVDAQRAAWKATGKPGVDAWSDIQVKETTFKRQVFLKGEIKILDAMEDLKFTINLM